MGRNRQKNCWNKGGITIFTAIVLAAVFFFNGVLLDWAAVLTAKENLPNKFYLAGNSLLAGFESFLFRDYCLMACAEKAEAERTLEYYFTGKNPSFSEGAHRIDTLLTGFRSGDLLPVSVLSGKLVHLSVQYKNSLADINVLQKNIVDIMKYRTPANFLEYLLEALDIVESAEEISEGEALFQEVSSLLEELSDGAAQLYRLVEGWSPNDISCVNGFDNVSARAYTHERIKTDSFFLQFVLGEALQEKENQNTLQRMQNNCNFLRSDLETYINLNKKAIDAIFSVRRIKERCEPRVAEMERWMKNYIPENEQEMEYAEKLQNRITELHDLMSKLEYRSNLESLEKNLQILEDGAAAASELADHLDKAQTAGIDRNLILDKLSVMVCKAVNSDIRIFTGYTAVNESLAEQDPRASAEQTSSDAVLPDISADAQIEESLFLTLPSLCDNFDRTIVNDETIWKSVLIDDYTLTYFNSAAGIARSGFSYFTGEVEYILNGEPSDADNIKSTQNKILGLRTALNLQHVLCDTEKMNLARAIGNALAGAMTCGIGGPMFTALVAGGWALGEAALDVQDLKNGKEVPLIKNAKTWKLSIAGLTEAVLGEENMGDDAPFTLDYSGYLRVLLLLTPQKIKLGRMADLIELNLTKQTNTRYYLGDLYTEIKISYQFYIPVSSVAGRLLPETRRKGANYVLKGEIKTGY